MKWNPKQLVDDETFDNNIDEISSFCESLKHPVHCISLKYPKIETENIVYFTDPPKGEIVA